ncbi:MAG: tetratricopeptide repeat protein [Rickettsiales bacterium]|jgi:tetratricopeptide (TPR) repeat protein|nr:tetratricopeptide repeat protein [Rickettsiales bacterium]
MPKSKLTVKSAEKLAPAKLEKDAHLPAPESDKVKKESKPRPSRARFLLWLLMGAFIIAVGYTLVNFHKPMFPRNAAKHIAEKFQEKKGAQLAEEPVVIVPEIDTSMAVVANAVVLSDEQKQQKAQEYILSGVELLKAGKADLALADFNSAIALFPTFAPSYVYRGEALFQKTDYAGAMESFDTALKIDENLAMSWFDKSVLQVKLGDLVGAMDSINAAINSYQNYPDENANIYADDLYRKRAQLNLWRKNWTDAIHDFTMASSFARNLGRLDFPDISGRADAKMGLGDFAGAVRDFDEVIKSVAAAIGRMDDEEEKVASATLAMEAFEKRAAIKLRLGDADGAREDLVGAIVLAEVIGDFERKESLEASLGQI